MKSTWSLIARCAMVIFAILALHASGFTQIRADFSANPVAGCAPMFVSFRDQSTGSPTSWKWDLGNGTVSYLQHPSATYFNPGKYTIRLVIKKGNAADSIVRTNFIIVNA